MAPREQPKTPTKIKYSSSKKPNVLKKGLSASATSVIKNTMSTVKKTDKTTLKVVNVTTVERQRTNTVPTPCTPKSKEAKPKVGAPGSVTKSAKKSWQRRPKPAHSGVPIPEKMRKLLEQQLADSDL